MDLINFLCFNIKDSGEVSDVGESLNELSMPVTGAGPSWCHLAEVLCHDSRIETPLDDSRDVVARFFYSPHALLGPGIAPGDGRTAWPPGP